MDFPGFSKNNVTDYKKYVYACMINKVYDENLRNYFLLLGNNVFSLGHNISIGTYLLSYAINHCQHNCEMIKVIYPCVSLDEVPVR